MRALLVILLLSAASPAAAETDAVANGRAHYNRMGCWQCHGYEGQGGAGPRVGPDPLPLTPFKNYVRAPTGSMPPYSERVLTDEELAHIHAYLQAQPPANPATRQIGRDLYPSSSRARR
jgi:mono/diheme cytochrome c family protein